MTEEVVQGPDVTALAHEAGDVRHTDCQCCAHAAKRTVALREMMANAIDLIQGDFSMEAACEMDRVLNCLNEWCEDGSMGGPTLEARPPKGAIDDDQIPF